MNDFEVMPIGTAVEIKALRDFSKRLISEVGTTTGVPSNIQNIVNEIERFYNWHVATYPVQI